jgi:hypothetical protein
MDILKMLAQSGSLSQLSQQYGISEEAIAQAIQMGLPEIAGAINKNTSTDQGLADFINAIQDHKDDDVEDMARDVNKIDTVDGEKILGHLFGNQKEDVALNISKKTGVQSMDIMKILSILAPLLMGSLGNQSKTRKMTDNKGIDSSLETILGGRSGVMGMVTSFLDKDKDGSIIDDLLGNMLKR